MVLLVLFYDYLGWVWCLLVWDLLFWWLRFECGGFLGWYEAEILLILDFQADLHWLGFSNLGVFVVLTLNFA